MRFWVQLRATVGHAVSPVHAGCSLVGQAILPAAAFQAARSFIQNRLPHLPKTVLLALLPAPRLLAFALLAAASSSSPEFVQAVEFPYYHHPRVLWERELVWLKNIGIRTVVFSVGQNPPQTDPRSDLAGFLKLLRRLGLRAWIYEVPRDLTPMLAMQLEQHGGPIAFVEGPSDLQAPTPPSPIKRISATDPTALLRSREVFQGAHGSLLWHDVEDTLNPGLERGVVSFAGNERPGATALRRDAALLRSWAPILPGLLTERKLPGKIPAVQLLAAGPRGASAVAISNATKSELSGPLRVYDASVARELIVPKIVVPAGQSLWLPVNIPLANGGLCEDCAAFAPGDRIVYATAELQSIEYENGILACEFSAPVAGEVVIQLSRPPTGPLIAGGTPAEFDWDEKNQVVRLPIPAGKGVTSRVRIGLAIEAPESSGFFGDSSRLIIGRPNIVATSYSSDALATRSRLLAPPGFRFKPIPKSPLEINYEVLAPADAPRDSTHGEFVTLALEADGVRLGRARLQLFRPASLRIREAIPLRLGADAELAPDPPLVSFDPKGGRDLHIALRNNYPSIQNYVVEVAGKGLTFLPARTEVSIAAATERDISVRVFSDNVSGDKREATIRITGAADFQERFQAIPLGRNETVMYSRDLDGDGIEDRVIENQRVRASFSGADDRWMEWVWKDSEMNLLPDSGLLPESGKKARRTVSLGSDNRLVIEQDQPLPPEVLKSGKKDGVNYTIERPSPNRAVYSMATEPRGTEPRP